MRWLRSLLDKINQATMPRDPEREYGTEETVRATEEVRHNGTAIKIITD